MNLIEKKNPRKNSSQKSISDENQCKGPLNPESIMVLMGECRIKSVIVWSVNWISFNLTPRNKNSVKISFGCRNAFQRKRTHKKSCRFNQTKCKNISVDKQRAKNFTSLPIKINVKCKIFTVKKHSRKKGGKKLQISFHKNQRKINF